MAKWFGKVGFMESVESLEYPGTFTEEITEKFYYGDILRFNKKWVTASDKENDDLNINNQISIVADPFATNHFHQIRYVEWMGTKFKATSVEVEYPRLIITIGGVYNADPDGQTG